MMVQSPALFGALCQRLGVQPDRRGEAAAPCPACGKPPKPRQVHFSFSLRGAACMVCGFRASLAGLARRYDLGDVAPIAAPAPPRPITPPRWRADAERLVARYCAHPDRIRIWRRYKPAITPQTLDRWQLGYGVLPLTSCHHPRLIVPVHDLDGRIVALKGRRVNCPPDCDHHETKWLSATGSDGGALWGARLIRPGARVYVVEAAVSAALWMQYQRDTIAVATLSAGVWRPAWTERLRVARWVKIVPDHDDAGYAAAEKIEGALKQAGIVRHVHRWPDGTSAKWDLADEVGRLLEGGVAA